MDLMETAGNLLFQTSPHSCNSTVLTKNQLGDSDNNKFYPCYTESGGWTAEDSSLACGKCNHVMSLGKWNKTFKTPNNDTAPNGDPNYGGVIANNPDCSNLNMNGRVTVESKFHKAGGYTVTLKDIDNTCVIHNMMNPNKSGEDYRDLSPEQKTAMLGFGNGPARMNVSLSAPTSNHDTYLAGLVSSIDEDAASPEDVTFTWPTCFKSEAAGGGPCDTMTNEPTPPPKLTVAVPPTMPPCPGNCSGWCNQESHQVSGFTNCQVGACAPSVCKGSGTEPPKPPGPAPGPGGSGCCSYSGECANCGTDGTGWCHQNEANCSGPGGCGGEWDPSGKPPSC